MGGMVTEQWRLVLETGIVEGFTHLCASSGCALCMRQFVQSLVHRADVSWVVNVALYGPRAALRRIALGGLPRSGQN